MITQQKNELKPCPFCGAGAVIMGKRAVYIMCGNYRCMARTEKFSCVKIAKEAWNRRTNDESKT